MDGFNIQNTLSIFTDFNDLAEKYHDAQPFFYDGGKNWWLWDFNKNCYLRKDEVDMLNMLDHYLNDFVMSSMPNYKRIIIDLLKKVGRRKLPQPMNPLLVQFKNIAINVITGEIFEPNPEYFCTNPIPWDYTECGETPIMDALFTSWVGADNVQLLYEIIAYCMLPSYPLSRIFCLVGAGSNGKSCFLEILTKFIGKHNICSTELDSLIKKPFEPSKLYKKLVCQMGETNFNVIEQTSILKKITGRDYMSIEFKGKDAFDSTNYAKLIIATNSLPVTSDKTFGFYRRWLVVDFSNTFTESVDILGTIPEIEYRHLACKCVTLLKNILKDRKFTNEGSVEERQKRYEDRSNPLKKFINEHCVENVNAELPFFRFYDHFKTFLERNNFRGISKSAVGRMIREMGFDIQKQNVKKPNGDGYTSWKYILGLSFGEKLTDFDKNSTDSTDSIASNINFVYTKTSIDGKHFGTIGTKLHHNCQSCGDPAHVFGVDGKPYCNCCHETLVRNGKLRPVEEQIE